MDLKPAIVAGPQKEKLNENLEVIDLGKIELKNGQSETLRLVRFAGKNDLGTWMGLFVPDGKEEVWDKWLERSGFKDKSVNIQLDPVKRERLRLLSRTNLSPIHIFNLAMNHDMDLTEIVEYYSRVKGPTMLAIGSEQSEQGKSTLTAIEGERWGGSDVFTADIFAKDNAGELNRILRDSGWDGKDVSQAFEIIAGTREWEKLAGVCFGDYLNLFWEKWTNTFRFMIIDLPGMKMENGQPTRQTDAMDALRMAIPCYEIPPLERKGNGFDKDYQEVVTEGYYKAIKDTWNFDKERRMGLRKLLE